MSIMGNTSYFDFLWSIYHMWNVLKRSWNGTYEELIAEHILVDPETGNDMPVIYVPS